MTDYTRLCDDDDDSDFSQQHQDRSGSLLIDRCGATEIVITPSSLDDEDRHLGAAASTMSIPQVVVIEESDSGPEQARMSVRRTASSPVGSRNRRRSKKEYLKDVP